MSDMIIQLDDWLLQLWNSPERWTIVMAGGWAAYYNGLAATTVPVVADVGMVASIAALPVVAMVGVFVALGAPYLQARQIVTDENNQSGFSQGFVMGLLGWEWSHVRDRFGRFGLLRIYQTDEALNVIRVNAYNGGLKAGYAAALALVPAVRKAYLSKLRMLAGHPSTGTWTRNDQISFVIELATTGLMKGVIKPQ